MLNFSLKNKVFVITGATGYLGSQMVLDLHSVGAKIAVLSTSLDKAAELCARCKGAVEPYSIDIGSKESIEECMGLVSKRFGVIDVLINNAFYGASKSFYDTADLEWDISLDGILKSVHRCVLAVLPYMENSKAPRVINVASMYGCVPPDPSNYTNPDAINPLTYGVSKSAVIHYTKYAAMILAKRGITANTVSYGPFPNPDKVTDEVFKANLSKRTMLNRLGNKADITAPIYFLALSESGYITGQNIIVDGGWTTW